MRKSIKQIAVLGAGIGAVLGSSVAAQSQGDPQRPGESPPGLIKALSNAMPGIQKALISSEGSNSRLQDLPVSV